MDELLHDRVRIRIEDDVARLTLSRPDAGNGFDLDMAHSIEAGARRIADGADAGRLRAAMIDAEGKAFSVGGDLAYFAGTDDRSEAMRQVAGALHNALRLLTGAPVPVVTAVHGVAAGGGIGLALAGDVVVAGPRAKFRYAYTAGGLSPDCGTTWLVPWRIGMARAMDLALTNRIVGADEAAAWGLVSRVVDSDDVPEQALAIAHELANGSRSALATTKELLWTSAERSFGDQLDLEASSIARLVDGPDGREGVDAFLAKRIPTFP